MILSEKDLAFIGSLFADDVGSLFDASDMGDAGFAVVGSNRPKLGSYGGDAPTARAVPPHGEPSTTDPSAPTDPGVARLLSTSSIRGMHAAPCHAAPT